MQFLVVVAIVAVTTAGRAMVDNDQWLQVVLPSTADPDYYDYSRRKPRIERLPSFFPPMNETIAQIQRAVDDNAIAIKRITRDVVSRYRSVWLPMMQKLLRDSLLKDVYEHYWRMMTADHVDQISHNKILDLRQRYYDMAVAESYYLADFFAHRSEHHLDVMGGQFDRLFTDCLRDQPCFLFASATLPSTQFMCLALGVNPYHARLLSSHCLP